MALWTVICKPWLVGVWVQSEEWGQKGVCLLAKDSIFCALLKEYLGQHVLYHARPPDTSCTGWVHA